MKCILRRPGILVLPDCLGVCWFEIFFTSIGFAMGFIAYNFEGEIVANRTVALNSSQRAFGHCSNRITVKALKTFFIREGCC